MCRIGAHWKGTKDIHLLTISWSKLWNQEFFNDDKASFVVADIMASEALGK